MKYGFECPALHTGEVLKPWDGSCSDPTLKYNAEESDFPMFISEDGTVYHINGSGDLCIWCTASRLRSHLHRLHQLGVI